VATCHHKTYSNILYYITYCLSITPLSAILEYMKLIVGLGNPGQQYVDTRHNTGRAALQQFISAQAGSFKAHPRFHAEVATLQFGDEKVLFALPDLYYNESGHAVRSLCDFYRIPASDVLIVHDELALPLGNIRTRVGGSDAGNNGVKSITQLIGQETARIRIGVGNERREQMDDADFVLGKFSSDERAVVADLYHVIDGCIEDFVYDAFTHTTHRAD
jgi:PTH1 family peptidyl-tRNA hydrolase